MTNREKIREIARLIGKRFEKFCDRHPLLAAAGSIALIDGVILYAIIF